MGTDGAYRISSGHDNAVWKSFFKILRGRMQRGDFTVVDATNSRTEELNRYKELCSEFRYRAYCVDFTDIPVDEVKRRNAAREDFRRVPEQVIDTIFDDAETVAETFRQTTPDNFFQIFGHRNTRLTPLGAEDRVFNLEGQVERGGYLRCLQVSNSGIRPVEILFLL